MDEAFHLSLDVTDDADVVMCTAVGEIDSETAPKLEGEVRAALFSSSASTLVIDLSRVTFMDSAGLRVVIDLHRAMQERVGCLVLRRPSATVARLLEITNLGASLQIEP